MPSLDGRTLLYASAMGVLAPTGGQAMGADAVQLGLLMPAANDGCS